MLRFLSILALSVAVIRLFAAGLLTPGYVVLALICGVAIMAMGPRFRMAAIAIGGLFFFARLHGGGDATATVGLMGQLLAIAIALCGIYIVIKGPFGGRKRT